MSKDRARPFSKKHRKYWIPVTGGMIFIGVVNVALGFCTYEKPAADDAHARIQLVIPKAQYKTPPAMVPVRKVDAGAPPVDAPPPPDAP